MPRKPKQPDTRGRGQIIPKGDRKWLLRIYLGRDGNGKRKYSGKTIEGTFKQAEQALTKMQGTVDEGSYVEPSRLTLCEFLTGYKLPSDLDDAIEDAADPVDAFRGWLGGRVDVSRKTLRGYCDRMRLDVLPTLGSAKLETLSRQRLQDLITSLQTDRQLSRRTIQLSVVVLKAALETAVLDHLIPRNPADRLVLPKKAHTEMRVLSAEQMATFLRKTSERPYGVLWTLLLTAGFRPQEALALQWGDVDFDTGTIKIVRALVETSPGTYAVGPVKVEASRRNVTVPQGTLESLRVHRRKQAAAILKAGKAYQQQGFIFATRTGGYLRISNIAPHWKADLKAAGLPVVRLYDARHSHQTALLGAGVNPKVVAERGGHSVEVLMSTYAHVLPSMQREASDTMGALMFKAAAL